MRANPILFLLVIGVVGAAGARTQRPDPLGVTSAAIEELHPHLVKRFESLSLPAFADGQIPTRFHIQAGVITPPNPDPDRPRLPESQSPTPVEERALRKVSRAKVNLELYTIGVQPGERLRVRGPIGGPRQPLSPSLLDQLTAVATQTDAKSQLSADSQFDDVRFRAKSIVIKSAKCLDCHTRLQVGDKVGTLVYRYWRSTPSG